MEDHFKEMRSIRFTVENKRLWLIDQRSVMTKSTQSDIRLLLDLYARKIVSDQYVVKQIKPGQLNEILHPIIDFTTVKGMPLLSGGSRVLRAPPSAGFSSPPRACWKRTSSRTRRARTRR